MAALKEIAREWASELREGIAWVIVWKTGRGWNAKAVWLNCEDEKLEPEDLGLARKALKQGFFVYARLRSADRRGRSDHGWFRLLYRTGKRERSIQL